MYDLKGNRLWDLDVNYSRHPKMKARKHSTALKKICDSPTTPEFLQRAAQALAQSTIGIGLNAAAYRSPFTS
jgi:hypothetical protein